MRAWLNRLLIPAIFATIFIVVPVLVITLSLSDSEVQIWDSRGPDAIVDD